MGGYSMRRFLSMVLVVLLLAGIGMIGASADVGDDLGEVPEDLTPTDPPGDLEAARVKVDRLKAMVQPNLFSQSDIQSGKSVATVQQQLVVIVFQTGVVSGNLIIDDYALMVKAQAGTLDAAINTALAEITALLQTELTAKAFQDFQFFYTMWEKVYICEGFSYSFDGSNAFPGIFNYPATNFVNSLPEPEMLAFVEKFNEYLAMIAYAQTLPQGYYREAYQYHAELWVCGIIALLYDVDLIPYIGVISKPVIPSTSDDPPDPSHFWDSWPPFLQWILRYLLFGWIWMK